MKLNPDDPRLSSYLLGELAPGEAAEVERALAADPALRVAVDQTLTDFDASLEGVREVAFFPPMTGG